MFELRKMVTTVEEILHDGGPVADKPLLRAGICVVVKNPYAGRYVEDLQSGMDKLKPLGLEAAKRLIQRMGVSTAEIAAYGKGAIVGEAGELEHGALWHVPGGYAMRELLGNAKAIVPSSKKMGVMGTAIDIPIHNINAAFVRGQFNAAELRVGDAPKADEIVFCLAMCTGNRIHDRMGGLKAEDIKGEDGLR